MVLAAGRGMRMRPLTDVTPKPLLNVQGKPLMQWPMEALLAGGFRRLVVNTAWLGEQIDDHAIEVVAADATEAAALAAAANQGSGVAKAVNCASMGPAEPWVG